MRSVTDYGVFIGIEDGVDGMVHKSDLSWTQRINNPADVYRKGDEVEAIILSINHDEKKVSLGIKQLYEDPWIRIPDQYPTGTVLEVRVISIADFGVFVELERGVEGLIHISELSHESVDDPSKVVKEGDIVKAEIIAIDPEERRIALSLKSAAMREETVEALKYQAESRQVEAGKGSALQAAAAPPWATCSRTSSRASRPRTSSPGRLLEGRLRARVSSRFPQRGSAVSVCGPVRRGRARARAKRRSSRTNCTGASSGTLWPTSGISRSVACGASLAMAHWPAGGYMRDAPPISTVSGTRIKRKAWRRS